ncbi:aquaporin, partial [Streptococcus pyogenes]
VSIAMFVNKRMDGKELATYIAAQIAGAFLATATLLFLASNAGLDTASLGENGFSTVNAAGAFIFEAIASFIFILTILTVT